MILFYGMMILIEKQTPFTNLIKAMNKTLLRYRLLSNEKSKREYYKVFFKNTPSAGKYSWNFPFVDIFFYVQNETYLWQMAESDSIVQTKYVFSLVMRPLGDLWLPTPRKPDKIFQFDPFNVCKGHFWDHRNETGQKEILLKCNDLKHIYPFVERDNQPNSTEFQD